ncbi:MAG: hypothetical protein AAF721_30860 [Myxococcota bacterium]
MDIDRDVIRVCLSSTLLVCLASCTIDKELGAPQGGEAVSSNDSDSDSPPDPGDATDSPTSADGEGATGIVDPSATGSTTGPEVVEPDPVPECRDSITCITGCMFSMALNPDPLAAVLECALECEPGAPSEAVKTLQLLECAAASCIDLGDCTEGDGTGGGTTDGGDTGTSDGAVCTTCLLLSVDEEQPPDAPCHDEAIACE